MAHRPPATIAVIPSSTRSKGLEVFRHLETELSTYDNFVILRSGVGSSTTQWRVYHDRAWRTPKTLPATREIVVFVEEQIIGAAGWLEQLLQLFLNDTLTAAAPRTNLASGDELLLGIPYRPYELGERDAFLQEFAKRGPVEWSSAACLDGPCLAVRRELLGELDLERIAQQGITTHQLAVLAGEHGELGIAERAFVHCVQRSGTLEAPLRADAPLVSACLIVKDEEKSLPRCLSSLTEVADEIVVYDTGSTDDTVALATEAGARVTLGYWDEDFSRARNEALAQCRGQWILWVDADEVLACKDPEALRAHLRALSSDLEGYLVTIDNVRGTDAATTLSHPACRLFRRANGHWDGRVHEQIVARSGSRDLAIALTDRCRITHWGYIQATMAARDKGTRNLRTAFGDLGGGSDLDLGERLTSLGRSYLMAGRLEEGLEITSQAIAAASRPSTERLARRALIEGLLAAGQAEEALAQCELLASSQLVTTLADAHAGSALLALGRYEEALERFGRVQVSTDDDGFSYDASFVAAPHAEALAALDRYDEAASLLLHTLREKGGLDAHLGMLADCLTRSGRSLEEIARAIPSVRARAFVPQLLQLRPDVADAVLEAWIAIDPDNLAVLATAARLAPRLNIARQLWWSTCLRRAGLGASCPLVYSTTDTGIDPATRVLAAATAVAAFCDERSRLVFSASVLGLSEELRLPVLQAVGQLNPESRALAETLRPAVVPVPEQLARALPPRRVVVICREALELRGFALAVRLASHGHDVTFLQPQPAAPAEGLLTRHGITTNGWLESGDWIKSACAFVAHLYEQQRIDVVVLSASAAELAPALRALLPVSELVQDLTGSGSQCAGQIALTIGSITNKPDGEGSEQRVDLLLADNLHQLFGELPTTPINARHGVLVVANLRAAPDNGAYFLEHIAPLLTSVSYPVALLGDDPDRLLSRALPEAIVLGAPADPTPWLRSVRAVLFVGDTAPSCWSELVTSCGTPSLSLSPNESPECVLQRLDELLETEQLETLPVPIDVSPSPLEDPLANLSVPFQRQGSPRGRQIGLIGGIFGHDSLSTVNRELAIRLAKEPQLCFSAVTDESLPVPADSVNKLMNVQVRRGETTDEFDVEIRHRFPPDFRPAKGALVLIQPWEFGGFPAEWIGPLRDTVDELWVPTEFVAECARKSGVAAEKVHVVPNGVDIALFSPDGPRRRLKTTKTVKLLFVGGLIERKGIDVLLEAYSSTFTKKDDVCLVVKPFGSTSVYRNSTLEPAVRRLAGGDGPEIEFVDDDLSSEQMADLYRACDALVLPYRGEGFGLPIAEAMACGLPVVVPNGGACLDFCDDEVAWLVAAREVPIVPAEWTPSKAGSWWLEPSRRSLGVALEEVVRNRELRARRGAAARQRIVRSFSWDAAASAVTARLSVLLGDSPNDISPSTYLGAGEPARPIEVGATNSRQIAAHDGARMPAA